jgi:hypothetical protein
MRRATSPRSRAGVLIAAAALTTSFFGSRAIGAELSAWVWIAVATFIVVGGCVLTVLWPRSDWSFNASAAEIIAEYIEPEPIEFPLVQRSRAAPIRGLRPKRPAARAPLSVFRIGLIVLVVEVAAWVVALAERA